MTSTTRVPAVEITGLYGTVVKRFSRKMLGEVPESLEVMWHNRPVLKLSMGLGRKSSRVGRVRRQPEVVRPHGGRRPSSAARGASTSATSTPTTRDST